MSTQDTTLPPLPEQERAAFEAEMRCEEKWGHKSLKRSDKGTYLNSWTAVMWEVWQARAAIAAQAQQAQGVPAGYVCPSSLRALHRGEVDAIPLIRKDDADLDGELGAPDIPLFAAAPQAEPAHESSEERRQLQHLLDDIVEEAEQDGATYYRIRDGKDILFSNLGGACARLLAQPEAQAHAVEAETQPEREPLTDEQIAAALEAGGVELQRFMGGIAGRKDCWTTAGSVSVPKIAAVVRGLMSAGGEG